MMHIPPSDARDLTLCEYQGILHKWEEAHATEDEALEPPDVATTEERRSRLEARGIKVLH